MNLTKPIRVKFKLENQLIEEVVEGSWTIGKIKGKIRKTLKINLYYELQLVYRGEVLENSKKFNDIDYTPETIIKVMALRAAEI